MDIEQLKALVWLAFMISLAIGIVYSMKRLKLKPLVSKVLIFSLLAINFLYRFFYGDPIAALFAWFSAVIAVSIMFDALLLLDKSLSEKLSVGLMLATISCGGVLTNAYILSAPISFRIKAFSLAVLVAIHIPFLVALIAYFRGRSDYSKRLVKTWHLA